MNKHEEKATQIVATHQLDTLGLKQAIAAALRATEIEWYNRGMIAAYGNLSETTTIRTSGPDGSVVLVPSPGHVLTDDGVVRRVLGTLPVTADGCVLGVGHTVHTMTHGGEMLMATTTAYADIRQSHAGMIHPEFWYSTKEAAEAASGKGGGDE